MKKYEKIGEKKFRINEIKKILQIEDEYEFYANLKSRVLQIAKKEIKQKCDIYFEMEEIKEGRRVDAIRFIIKKNRKENDIAKPMLLTNSQQKTFERITHEFSMSDQKLTKILKKFPFEKIEQAFFDVIKRRKSGTVKNEK